MTERSNMSELPADELPPRPRTSNLYVLIFGGIMLAGLMVLAWIGQPPASTAIGEPLPRLDLQPLVHATQPLTREDLNGKLVVLHFWGTWCPPCQREFPEFAKLAAEFQGNDEVAIVSVSSSGGPEYDLDDLRQKTEAFLEDFSAPIPTYSDPAAMTRGQIALLLSNGSLGYPTTLLVDRDGKIIHSMEGYLEGEMAELGRMIHLRL